MKGSSWLIVGALVALLILGGAEVAYGIEMAYSQGRPLGEVELWHQDGVLMTSRQRDAWIPMRDAAAAAGVTLRPDSGFRTMAEQTQLWNEHVAGTRTTPVARPGYSRHQNGLALDIQVHSDPTSAEYRWLAANASQWGWSNTGAGFHPPEFWHWELSA